VQPLVMMRVLSKVVVLVLVLVVGKRLGWERRGGPTQVGKASMAGQWGLGTSGRYTVHVDKALRRAIPAVCPSTPLPESWLSCRPVEMAAGLGGIQRGLRATDPPLRARVDSTDSNPPAPPSTGYGPPAAALQPVCCTCCTCCTYSCPGSCG
jgi:hypothetical protein